MSHNEHEHYDAHGDTEWACGGDGDCDTIETYRYRVRCVLCGCERTTTEFGSQRNPGQCDTVRYEDGEQTLLDTVEARAEARRQKRNARQREQRRLARLKRSTPAHA